MSGVVNNPGMLLDAFDDAAPQQAYQELGRCPFHRPDGMKVLAKREDIVQFLRHPAVRSAGGDDMALGAAEPLIPLHLDGPEQRMFRRILDPLFSPRVVDRLKPTVRAVVDQLLDAFVEQGHAELFGSFCMPLPTIIFVHLLGLPEEDVPLFVRFKDAVVRPVGDTLEEQRAYARREGAVMYEYLNWVCDEREASGELGEDLIGGFLRTEVDGRKLTRSEILNIVYLLVVAGLDTVTSSLSCMLSLFAARPEKRAEVVADPSLLPSAVEELMRYETPVLLGRRWVTEDFELNGWRFRAGEEVEVMWSSANLDPDAFENPMTLDLGRRRNAHFGFGAGPHRCLGSNLARMELITALERFHERIPEYAVTPGEQVDYVNVGVRMAHHLPISFPKGVKRG